MEYSINQRFNQIKKTSWNQTKDAGNFFWFEIEKALSWETKGPAFKAGTGPV